jgi:hypothetical protein
MALMESGWQCPTVPGTVGSYGVNPAQLPKPRRGSDRGLKLTLVKTELGVIANQHVAVNHKTVVVLTAHHGLGGWDLRSDLGVLGLRAGLGRLS